MARPAEVQNWTAVLRLTVILMMTWRVRKFQWRQTSCMRILQHLVRSHKP